MKPNETIEFKLDKMEPNSVHVEKTPLANGDIIQVTFYTHGGSDTHRAYLVDDNDAKNGVPSKDATPVENGQHVFAVENGKRNVMFIRSDDGYPYASCEFAVKLLHNNILRDVFNRKRH